MTHLPPPPRLPNHFKHLPPPPPIKNFYRTQVDTSALASQSPGTKPNSFTSPQARTQPLSLLNFHRIVAYESLVSQCLTWERGNHYSAWRWKRGNTTNQYYHKLVLRRRLTIPVANHIATNQWYDDDPSFHRLMSILTHDRWPTKLIFDNDSPLQRTNIGRRTMFRQQNIFDPLPLYSVISWGISALEHFLRGHFILSLCKMKYCTER